MVSSLPRTWQTLYTISIMSRPRVSDRYPLAMLEALQRAFSDGELTIPIANPAALRLQFYGLGRALREEGKSELFDQLSFTLSPAKDALIIRLRDNTAFAKSIEAALAQKDSGKLPSALQAAEESLARILGEKP